MAHLQPVKGSQKVREVDPNTGRRKGRGRPSKAEMALRAEEAKKARKTNETPEQRVARIADRFTVMYRLTQGVINGAMRSLIVSGAPGMGKSHTIEVQLLSPAADKGQIKLDVIRGSISPVDLYKRLYKFSSPNSVILLDDADSIYEDEDGLNILKAALDTSKTRKISWLRESSALKSEEVPNQFIFEGAMIFITNKDFQWIVEMERNKLVPHIAALMDRSKYLDLKLHDIDDCTAWVGHMVRKQNILVQHGLTREQQEKALDWLTKNYSQLRSLSIRTMMHVAEFILASPLDWEKFAKTILLR